MQLAKNPQRAMLGFAFSLAGAILILLRGLVRIWVGDALAFAGSDVLRHRFLAGIAWSVLGGIAVAFAIIILVGAFLIYNGMETAGGIIVLIFSGLSIFVGSGWFLGLILGIVGGVLGLLKK
jgi:hypothetical protein